VGVLEDYALPLAPQVLVTSFGANGGRFVLTRRDILRKADQSWLAGVRLGPARLQAFTRRAVFISSGNDPLSVPLSPITSPSRRRPPTTRLVLGCFRLAALGSMMSRAPQLRARPGVAPC